MEHLVKRDPGFSVNVRTSRNIKIGKTGNLTQSRVGGDPFKLDEDGFPSDVKRGDVVWIMESGYGVYAKFKIKRISETKKIKSLKDLDKTRIGFPFDFQLQDKFWDGEEKKLKLALSKNKYLHFIVVTVVGMENLEDFPIQNKPGLASSWIKLNEEKKKYFFALKDRGMSCEENIVKNLKEENYTKITTRVKHNVVRLWEYKTVTGKEIHKTKFDLDHLIPKSMGGAGIFVENIVPLESSVNRFKSNRIPISFAKVAVKYNFKQINQKILDDWSIITKSSKDRRFIKQKSITKSILSEIKKWSIPKQRKFYFKVLCEEYGYIQIEKQYKKAGIPIP